MKPAIAIKHPSRLSMRALRLAVAQRERSGFHWERKFYHCLMGIFCFVAYAFVLDRTQALMLLGTIGGVWVALDVIRFSFPRLNVVTLRLFGRIMRREELRSVSGNSFYILGLFTLVFFFPPQVACLSILLLAFGDPAAAVVGSLYGKHKLIGKKTLEGAMANFATSTAVVFLAGLFYFQLPTAPAIAMALGTGVISVVVELLPIKIDDNFSIPVFSAILLNYFLPLIPGIF